MDKINIDQLEISEVSNKNRYMSIIESLLFASGEPLKIKFISDILECDKDYTKDILDKLMQKYGMEDRGIKLVNMNGEYQLVTKPDNYQYVQKLLKTNTRQSLSQAALETLSIIAYKQPITRIDIDEIRGVKSDRAIVTLVDRKLIKESGRMDVPGRPILYATTSEFLKYFDLENLNELPNIEEITEDINEDTKKDE